jgi:hypothetical protein
MMPAVSAEEIMVASEQVFPACSEKNANSF